ncbi:Kae1-associated serine/threonine protein kinase [Candidatus Pacearchaeota archaeon]|nr:Kae1-associated serine/threonine protein kinase [Candidatus Pacearchaeota archaeon]
MSKILAQGAEAIIRLENQVIIKRRIPKTYRLKILDDKIIKLRTRSELKLLEKASRIVNIPKVISSNDNKIVMEFIAGHKLSSSLDNFPLKNQKQILNLIGKDVSKLHGAGIIHGDLTTSNMILVNNSNNKIINVKDKNIKKNRLISKNKYADVNETNKGLGGRGISDLDNKNTFKIFFIDFGLGFISNKPEDKAVDLHLLKQALEAKHFKNWQELWKEFEKGYKHSKESVKVFERLKAVEKRGRYKERY